MKEPGLTSDQEQAEARMLALLASLGREAHGRLVDGAPDMFLHYHVRGSSLEVWIHEASMQIYSGRKVLWWRETVDYGSYSAMVDEFLEDLEVLCKRIDLKPREWNGWFARGVRRILEKVHGR